jgi:hypothetical protein
MSTLKDVVGIGSTFVSSKLGFALYNQRLCFGNTVSKYSGKRTERTKSDRLGFLNGDMGLKRPLPFVAL